MDIHVNRSARVAETPLTPQLPALVLFGRSSGGRPCAAWFEAADTQAATAAAKTMQLRALPLITPEQRELAAGLPRGRVTPSGRARLPFAKHDLYARLVAIAGEEAGLRVAGGEQGAPTADPDRSDGAAKAAPAEEVVGSAADEAQRSVAAAPVAAPEPSAKARSGDRTFVGQPRPQDRDEIGLGSLVLAHEGPDDGWWEAEVIGINGRVLSLRWRDYPTQPTILRKVGELALLPPGEA